MQKSKSLLDVFERNRYDLASSVGKSKAWFNQQVLLMSKQKITPNRVMNSESTTFKTRVVPGNMYMFFYDPKGKDTLPYYDRFPLVLPYAKTPDGFIGLNMHYLPYQYRIKLLDKLLQFKTNNRFDETTKIKYSWSLISGLSKFNFANPCIKQYLNEHLRSPLTLINANDWATAMMLPVERFVGSSSANVWRDSLKKI